MMAHPLEPEDVEEGGPQYLRGLAERLMRVPAMYGVDQSDVDILQGIAASIEERLRK